MTTHALYLETPLLGGVRLVEEGGFLTRLDIALKSGEDGEGPAAGAPGVAEGETPLLLRARQQLEEYLAGKRRDFDLPLAPRGTEFQQRVWKALREIPYGQTRSYRQTAEAAGCPRGYRAVGLANNRNPIAVVIPCHRVIGADGRLVGYGSGLPVKEALLRLERSTNAMR